LSKSIRKYNAEKDRSSVYRIWRECGWISDEKKEKEAADAILRAGRSFVFDHNGSAECLVTSADSRLVYNREGLRHAAITSVTTSRIVRNLGAASSTLAYTLSKEAENGFATSGLGMFEQGFYNRLGYGTGVYENWIAFDPAWLTDLPAPEVPRRFDIRNYKLIHQARLNRRKAHGAVDLISPELTRADMLLLKNTFCLGYKDGRSISHCVVMFCSDVEQGPYKVMCLVYKNFAQLRELLALIKGLSDQIRQVRLREPREIQIQDFLDKPFQLQTVSQEGKFEAGVRSDAYWQVRILDMKKCISAMKCGADVKFNLTVEDPIERFLPAKSAWKGCGGEYTVSLGSTSSIKKGASKGLDTLSASINDFTRYWLGVQTAEALNVTGLFDGPQRLLEKLDAANGLSSPEPDWDY